MKSKNIKVPPKPRKYSIGSPLAPDTVLVCAGVGCQSLHVWYMQKTNEKGYDTGITIRYTKEHFFHEPSHFVVGFNDLFDLFNLNALDASLL